MGQAPGRNNQKQDIAFQFKNDKGVSTGVLFGDEFDLPLENLSVAGDRVSFSVTVLNYYDNRRAKFLYNGIIKEGAIEFTRDRVPDGVETDPAKKPEVRHTFTITKLT